MPAFPDIAKIKYEGPDSRTRWRSATTTRANWSKASR